MDTGSSVPVYFLATLRACFSEKKGYVSACFISSDDSGGGRWRMRNADSTGTVCPSVMPLPGASRPLVSTAEGEGPR